MALGLETSRQTRFAVVDTVENEPEQRTQQPTRSAGRGLSTKAVLVGADLAAAFTSMAVAVEVDSVTSAAGLQWPSANQLTLMALSLPLWPMMFSRNRLYTSRFIGRRLDEFKRLVSAVVAVLLGISALAFITRLAVPRAWLLLSGVIAIVAIQLEREIARRHFAVKRRQGYYRRPVLIVGCNAEALELAGMLNQQIDLGYEVVGLLADDQQRDATPLHLPVLGTSADAHRAVVASGATGVIIAATATDMRTSNRLIRELTELGVHVELSSSLLDIAANRLTVRPLGRFPVVYVEPVQRAGWPMIAKRIFDLTVGCFGLLVAGPIMLAAAIAVRLDSKGPILFRQTRVGRDGVPFTVLKFRTMVVDAEARIIDLRKHNEADGPLFKMKNDPRVTRVGRFLRKTSIDELPQLFNVVKGEMSLVGPRPALPREVAEWEAALHNRLRVKPGITGMWQVNGRSSSSFEEYTRLDLYYVDNWSFVTDLVIVLKTIPAVLLQRGAH